MTEAYLPPIPDPVITTPMSPRIATDPEGRTRRRANGRGLNAFVIVKPQAGLADQATSEIDEVTGCGPVTPLRGALPRQVEAEALVEAPVATPLESPLEAASPPPQACAEPAPAAALPAAPSAPVMADGDPLRFGQAVAEALATAVTAQSDLAERYLTAARRIDELEAERGVLMRAREADAEAFAERVRQLVAEREAVMIDLVARLHGLEAERDRLAEELGSERDRRLVEAAELLADVLTPRLCGVLDEHTGLADRYAAAAQRVGELEGQVARLKDQLNGAHAWRSEFSELERAATARPWWKFWG